MVKITTFELHVNSESQRISKSENVLRKIEKDLKDHAQKARASLEQYSMNIAANQKLINDYKAFTGVELRNAIKSIEESVKNQIDIEIDGTKKYMQVELKSSLNKVVTNINKTMQTNFEDLNTNVMDHVKAQLREIRDSIHVLENGYGTLQVGMEFLEDRVEKLTTT